MTDRVLWETDDSIDEGGLRATQTHPGRLGYAPVGFGVTGLFADDAVQVASGIAHVAYQDRGVSLVVDGRDSVSLADPGGANTLFVGFDPDGQDSVFVDVLAGGEPAQPAVAIADVDAAAETITETNRLPSLQAQAPSESDDVARKAETDALDAAKVDLPIGTADLSDDAITAAKIAVAAVGQEAIGENAVGVDELLDGLGTSESNPVPGTTHMESASADNVSATNTDTDTLNDADINAANEGEVLQKDSSQSGLVFGGSSASLQANSHQDVSDSRSFGTVYQNTSGKPLVVQVLPLGPRFDRAELTAELLVGESSSPSIIVSGYQFSLKGGDEFYNAEATLTAIVPNTHYYKLVTNESDGVKYWTEQELTIV